MDDNRYSGFFYMANPQDDFVFSAYATNLMEAKRKVKAAIRNSNLRQQIIDRGTGFSFQEFKRLVIKELPEAETLFSKADWTELYSEI